MNFNEEVQKATDKFVAEKLPALIEEKIASMVKSVLDDVFRSYSDIGKQIKEKIEKGLDINLQRYDLVDYNAMVANAINARLVQVVNENAIKPIMQLVDETVGFVEKKTIKLSEIHKMVKEESMDYHSQEGEGEISFYAVQNFEHKWTTVSFSIDKGVSQEDCDMEFSISDNGRIFLFKSKSHWSEKDNLTPSKVTQLSDLEHKIFRLYSAQVKVEVDTTDFEYENQWSRYE